MRIIHVTPRYFPHIGGVETVVKEICERLVKNNHDVIVYTTDLGGRLPRIEFVKGVCVKRYRALLNDPFYLPSWRFFWDLRKEKSNIIHVHNIQILLTFFAILFKTKIQKTVLQPHYHRFGQTRIRNFLLKIFRYIVNQVISANVDLVVTNSHYEEKLVEEDFPRFKKIMLIEEALDVEELNSVKWVPELPWKILYIGALRKYKNVDKLLRAFEILKDLAKKPLMLVIVGDGPEKTRLKDLTTNLGIGGHVVWKRDLSRKELLREYSQARIFVLLSKLESYSRVVHEALAIGVPTVLYSAGATYIQKGLAEAVHSLEPAEIANSILKVLRKEEKDVVKSLLPSWREYLERLLSEYHLLIRSR